MYRVNVAAIMSRFLAGRATKEFRRLVFSMSILNLALGAVAIFEPIYLSRIGFSLSHILLFYMCTYALTFVLYPLGVRISARFGYHHSILFASPFLIAYYLAMYAIPHHPAFIAVSIFSYAMYIVLYWPNVHLECTREACEEEQGREMSTITAAVTLSSVAGPLVGGLIAGFFGFPVLFAAASILILISNIPLMTLPERKEGEGFGYVEAWRNFMDTSGVRARTALATIGIGEDAIAMFIWPVALLSVLGGYTETGAAVSLSLLITTVSLMFIGRMADAKGSGTLLRAGSVFTALAWIARAAVSGVAGGIFAGDLFYRIARNTASIPMISSVYRAARRSDARKHIAFFEMRLFLAKAAACGVGIILLAIFPGSFAPLFIFAALLALFYSFMPKSDAA